MWTLTPRNAEISSEQRIVKRLLDLLFGALAEVIAEVSEKVDLEGAVRFAQDGEDSSLRSE